VIRFLYVGYAALLGAAVGSFLNVCISRLPEGESVIAPGSRCPICGSRIRWHDNLPVLGWLWLRGRCRDCGGRISPIYPLVEAAGAVIWAGSAAWFGLGWGALHAAVFLSLLLAIGVTDARHYLIPDALSVGGLGAGLGLSLLPDTPDPASAALGAAAGYGVLLAVGWLGERIFEKPAMGGGDMKMMAMVGAFLGPVKGLLTIFLGALAGAIVFGPVSLRTGKLVPFGVFLALGAAASLFFGDPLVEWYTGFF